MSRTVSSGQRGTLIGKINIIVALLFRGSSRIGRIAPSERPKVIQRFFRPFLESRNLAVHCCLPRKDLREFFIRKPRERCLRNQTSASRTCRDYGSSSYSIGRASTSFRTSTNGERGFVSSTPPIDLLLVFLLKFSSDATSFSSDTHLKRSVEKTWRHAPRNTMLDVQFQVARARARMACMIV